MRFGRRAALVPVVLGSSAMIAPEPAPSSVPLIWRDVSRLQVLCLVTTPSGVDTGALRDELCRAVTDAAGAGAPMPVSMLPVAGREVLDAQAVTLLVHASVSPSPAGRVMAFSIRPYRNVANDPGLLFAAAPRAVLLGDAPRRPELRAAVRASLAETLPWAASPTEARPTR